MQAVFNRPFLLLFLASAAGLGAWLHLRPSADIRAFRSILHNWTPERCKEVARLHPGTTGGLAALLLAAPDDKESRSLLEEAIPGADATALLAALERMPGRWERQAWLAPLLLDRAKTGSPEAGRFAASACLAARTDDKPSDLFTEAADLIASRFASEPDLERFCAVLGETKWGMDFERHLSTIREANPHPATRTAATLALAGLLSRGGPARRAEAVTLYQRLLDENGGTRGDSPSDARRVAQSRLASLRRAEEAGTSVPIPAVSAE